MANRKTSADAYRADLAFIHDAGFGGFAREAAGELVDLLRTAGICTGQVVDLGCGSGILAEAVSRAGYEVVGFDISAAMVALARGRVPAAEFRHESYLAAQLPACVAVAAIGEVFNYLFDAGRTDQKLWSFFRCVHRALERGGLFLFDMAGPGRGGPQQRVRNFTEVTDWACLYAAEEDRRRCTLTREITTFRRAGNAYHRDHEVHRLRLYPPAEVLAKLRAAGFRARTTCGYRSVSFPPGWTGFLARKA